MNDLSCKNMGTYKNIRYTLQTDVREISNSRTTSFDRLKEKFNGSLIMF
jgi:hypothetical protein